VVHTVKSGDTIWGIAIQYATGSETTPEEMLAQINRLNNNPSLIYTGQEIVIAVPGEGVAVAQAAAGASEGESAPAASESDEQAPAPAEGEGAQPAAPTEGSGVLAAAASSSTLCVSAYNDRNTNGMRDPTTEELLAEAGFTLSSESGVVGSYTSDGSSEPHCFTQLLPGTYMVQLARPGGYNTTTPEYWAVPLPAGATANVEFGHTADPNAPPSVQAAASDSAIADQTASENSEDQAGNEEGSKSLLSSLGEIAIGVSGIFVLLLAAAVGVAFVASRRRV
jgi:LysM repeat protein